jgi:hypothetical protein
MSVLIANRVSGKRSVHDEGVEKNRVSGANIRRKCNRLLTKLSIDLYHVAKTWGSLYSLNEVGETTHVSQKVQLTPKGQSTHRCDTKGVTYFAY